MTKTICLRDYDENWPKRFEAESKKLKDALGDTCVEIHHVGSTAVPGLAAKPIIDIVLEVNDYPPNSSTIHAMENLEYESMGECGVSGRHWFRKGQPRSFHVHVVPVGGDVALRQVAFRDFLRNHPEARFEYELLKRNAADGRDIDSSEYAAAKSLFIENALRQQGAAADADKLRR